MRSALRPDLFAGQRRESKLDRLGDPLIALNKHIDFAALAAEVDRVAPRPDSAQGGRPPYPTETMVPILVVKRLHNLSDEQVEFQLNDRLSSHRFLRPAAVGDDPGPHHGLDLREPHRCRWRQGRLRGCAGATAAAQLPRAMRPDHRCHLGAGTASAHRQGGQGGAGEGRSARLDAGPEASARHRRELDQGARQEPLWLQAVGHRKAQRNRALSERQKERNRRIATVRARVEHVFGSIAPMGGKLLRTIGQARADFAMTMMAVCYNLKRLTHLESVRSTGK